MTILPKFHYGCYDFVELIGLSGSLCICWNSSVLTLDIVFKNERLFHCLVYVLNQNTNSFYYIHLWISTTFQAKTDLDILISIKDSICGPWAVIGDFKEILHPYEKIVGNPVNTSRMHDFAEFINNCHLLELGSFGLPFTWFNKRGDTSSIFENLDRGLINQQQIYSFEDARVENLPIIGSDHGSIVLHLDKRDFELNLLAVKNFDSKFPVLALLLERLGSTCWEGSNVFKLVKKIQCFRKYVKAWNKQKVDKLEDYTRQTEKEVELVQISLMVSSQHLSSKKEY